MNPDRMPRFRFSILLWTVAALPMVLVVVTFIASLPLLARRMESALNESAVAAAVNFGSAVNQLMERPVDTLFGISRSRPLDADSLAAYLSENRRESQFFTGLRLIDPIGRVVAVAPAGDRLLGYDLSEGESYKSLIAGQRFAWSPTYIDTSSERPIVDLMIVYDSGMIQATVDLAYLAAEVRMLQSFQPYSIRIVDERGTYVVHPDPSFVEQRRNAIDMALSRPVGESVFSYSSAESGRPEIVTAVDIPTCGWTVLLGRPADDVEASVRTLLLVMGIGISLVAAAVALLIRTGVGLVSKDFSGLLDLIRNTAEGAYQGGAQSSAIVEFREIETRFLEMRRRVEQREQTLEDRVRDRTNQLIESEKLVMLGQLAAGIAHEVNTPLGAIRASAVFSLGAFEELAKDHFDGRNDAATEAAASELLALCDYRNGAPVGAEERQKRKTLTAELSRRGFAESRELATKLIDMNFRGDLEAACAVLRRGDPNTIVAVAERTAALFQSLRVITESADRAAAVVMALKAYIYEGAADAGNTVDLRREIENVLVLFRNRIKQGVAVSFRMDGLPPVKGNAGLLAQVWTNLVSNALDAMDDAGRLEIEGDRLDGKVRVRVIDSGHGISEELKGRLFTPFVTTKPRGKGTGLGLDIVKRVVEAHGGSIDFTSEPGRTVFEVLLPSADGPED